MTGSSDRVAICRDDLLFVTLVVVALVVGFLLRASPVTADTTVYRDRMVEVFSGNWPYFETRFEHFPLTLIPMILAWLLGGFAGSQLYRLAFSALMAVCLWAVFRLTGRVGHVAGQPAAHRRWLWMAAPLFPLVLFRNDPWSLLFVAASLAAYVTGRRGAGWTTAALGVAAKGWPVVVSLLEWTERRRLRALLLATVAGALLVALVMTPGFLSGRQFAGTHTESTLGGLIGLVWSVADGDQRLIAAAGATYLAAPSWVTIAQLSVGLFLFVLVLLRLSGNDRSQTFMTLGLLTICGIIGSPLLSAQFLLWPSVFLALQPSKTVRILLLTAGALSTSIVASFSLLTDLPMLWFGMVTLRNVILFVLIVVGLRESRFVTRSA